MSSFMNHSFKATSDQSDWIDDMGDTDTTHGFFSKFAKKNSRLIFTCRSKWGYCNSHLIKQIICNNIVICI